MTPSSDDPPGRGDVVRADPAVDAGDRGSAAVPAAPGGAAVKRDGSDRWVRDDGSATRGGTNGGRTTGEAMTGDSNGDSGTGDSCTGDSDAVDAGTGASATGDSDTGSSNFDDADGGADRRFAGVARLYGVDGLARLQAARVAVVGLGGVGSWAVEALARSGVGRLTLVDLDHVSESNINRQSHALDSTVGAAKAAVLARRVADIGPQCQVDAVEDFVDAGNVGALLPPGRFDYVIDAVDEVRAKIVVIAHCRLHGIPLVTVGGAGGRTDATRVRVADLTQTRHEPMLAKVRKTLRARHGFPPDGTGPFDVAAVFSDHPLPADDEHGSSGREGNTGLNCAGFGSVVSVTAVFGFVAAGAVIDRLARGGQPGAGR